MCLHTEFAQLVIHICMEDNFNLASIGFELTILSQNYVTKNKSYKVGIENVC